MEKNPNNLLIHISGVQGVGKSTLGSKIKDKYNDSIYLKDLDDLNNDFSNQNLIENYQEYLDNFITTHSDKPLVLTGLSAEMCKGEMNDMDKTFYQIDTPYKFFIDIDENIILQQRFFRQVTKLYERKEMFFDKYIENNDEIQQKLFRFVDLTKWKINNVVCKNIHLNYGYVFLDRNEIFLRVVDLLS